MEQQQITFGYVPSVLDGSEIIYSGDTSLDIPEEYSYVEYLPKVYDQGQLPICVTCSCGAYINWNINVDSDQDNKTDNGIKLLEIYKARTNQGDGMTFKEALKFLRNVGVNTNKGLQKIERYAFIPKNKDFINTLKLALIDNGPCVGAFIVRDPNCGREFWKGESMLGGHAISIVGYNKTGFIVRNSWSEFWGDNGYTILPYDEVYPYLLECWTIIA